MEDNLNELKLEFDELQIKLDELEEEFRKLSRCDKFCLLIIQLVIALHGGLSRT